MPDPSKIYVTVRLDRTTYDLLLDTRWVLQGNTRPGPPGSGPRRPSQLSLSNTILWLYQNSEAARWGQSSVGRGARPDEHNDSREVPHAKS
jgi:hypothetical protein